MGHGKFKLLILYYIKSTFIQIFSGEIAIDDILVNFGPCPTTTVCDFEAADLCGYLNDKNNDFDWSRVQGNEESFDHSYGTSIGHYMKATSPSNPVLGRTARLTSQSYPAATVCTQFWYKTSGNLHFSLKTYTFGSLSTDSYFKFRGSNGNEWTLGQATIKSPNPFQLAFETLISTVSSMGYTLLDDVEIKFNECDKPASCDFEDGFCGYSSLGDADFEWIILDGEYGIEQSQWLVPQFDNTFGSPYGRFIYLDVNRNAGLKAKLQSETLVASSTLQCVQFYIYLKKNGGTLNVYRLNKLTSQSDKLFTESADLYDLWYEREIELTILDQQVNQDVPIRLIFEGVTLNAGGVVAVDDIKLYDGKCLGTQVLPGSFNCQNGQTIDKNKVCDFNEDCSNGQDEKFCGTCNFEDYGSCGWLERNNGAYYWQRNRNGTIGIDRPTNDQTYGNRTGFKNILIILMTRLYKKFNFHLKRLLYKY